MFCTRVILATLALAVLSAAATSSRQPAQSGELVIAKEGTGHYHWPGCPVIRDGQRVLALTRPQADRRGLKPHSDCNPSKTTGAGERGSSPPGPQPAVTVYVDGPRYYHRHKECSRLDPKPATVKPLPLEDAAKSHWPCPACKAPIFKKNTEPAVPGTNRHRGG